MRAGRAWRGALLPGIAAGVIALDQWSKSRVQQSLRSGVPHHVVGPTYLVLTFNQGAAFSLGSGASPVIAAVAVALAVAVLWFSGRLARGGGNVAAIVGFGLLSGGALSNLADRFFRHHHGGVVDFIQLVSWWPIFNVADAAITVGAATIAVALVFFSVPMRPAPSTVQSSPPVHRPVSPAGPVAPAGPVGPAADDHALGQHFATPGKVRWLARARWPSRRSQGETP